MLNFKFKLQGKVVLRILTNRKAKKLQSYGQEICNTQPFIHNDLPTKVHSYKIECIRKNLNISTINVPKS